VGGVRHESSFRGNEMINAWVFRAGGLLAAVALSTLPYEVASWPPPVPSPNCYLNTATPGACLGSKAHNEIDNPNLAASLLDFAETPSNFFGSGVFVPRTANCVGCSDVGQRVDVIADGQQMYLPYGDSREAIVLGRITLQDQLQEADKTFQLSSKNGEPMVFLLIGRLEGRKKIPAARRDFRVAQFEIVGFVKEGKKVKLRSMFATDDSRVTHCGHAHPQNIIDKGADFLPCPSGGLAIELASELGIGPFALMTAGRTLLREGGGTINGRTLTESQLTTLRQIIASSADGPVWFTCGVGCCIGDPS
jgi:hypothetical protein